jgi:hypothetical protein
MKLNIVILALLGHSQATKLRFIDGAEAIMKENPQNVGSTVA